MDKSSPTRRSAGSIPARAGSSWLYTPSRPSAVAEGGGAVWVVSAGDSTLYRFNPETFLEGPIGRAGVGGPLDVNRVWSRLRLGHQRERNQDLVARIDPGNYASGFRFTSATGPVAVAVGEGAVWVANAGDGTVSRIDPETNDVVETVVIGQAPAGIAVGHGLVWVAVQSPLALQADGREHEPGPEQEGSPSAPRRRSPR